MERLCELFVIRAKKKKLQIDSVKAPRHALLPRDEIRALMFSHDSVWKQLIRLVWTA